MTKLRELALALYEIEAVAFGEFTLHSGKKSPVYIDLRLLVSYPSVLSLVADAYGEVLQTLAFDLLTTAPIAGLPISTAIALQMERPLIYPRKKAKGYGSGKLIEGAWDKEAGQTAVVVDDLITSGDSIIQTIVVMRDAGLQIQDSVVLIDREQGGRDALQAVGCTLHPVMTITQLLTELVDAGKLTAEQKVNILQALHA